MKTIGLWAGFAGALLASVGCGGTVVFEEDGGEGGQGAGSSQNGPTTSVANGGGNPVSSTAIGTTAPATVGPGPSTSTGPAGCGSFLESFNSFTADCIGCLDANCCTQQLACDVGTECYDCFFGSGNCTEAAIAASEDLFNGCYPVCQEICDQSRCGDAFQCFDGTCLSFEFVCDGFPDCFEGEDEDFCRPDGICGSGVTLFDARTDQCLGDFCCDEFFECASFGEDPEACQQCLQNGGGDLCERAIECAVESPCFGRQQFEICGGLSVDDPDLAECLNGNCCEELDQCASGPDGPDGCAQCFQDGGPLCDPVSECYFQNCDEGFDGDGDGGDPDRG